MSIRPYINKEEYRPVFKMKTSKQRLVRMKALADAGNIEAALFLASRLMCDEWDYSKMETDLARGQLLPPTANLNEDPYLLMKRDQYRALDYYKIVASHPPCFESKFANDILIYCKTKAEIGYNGKVLNNPFMLKIYENMEKMASPETLKASPFIALPFQRPHVMNPKTGMFIRVAQNAHERAYFMISVFHIIAFFMSLMIGLSHDDSIYPAIGLNVLVFVVFTFPILVFAYFSKIYGVEKEMPICSCSKLRETRAKTLANLPDDCKDGDLGPFEQTAFFIRNLVNIKKGLFLSYLIMFALFALLSYQNLIDQNILMPTIPDFAQPFFFIVMIAFPIIALIWEVRFGFKFVDRDCANEFDLVPEPEKMSEAA